MILDFNKMKRTKEKKFLDIFENLRMIASKHRNQLLLNQNIDSEIDMRFRFFNLMYKTLIFYDINLLLHIEKLIEPENVNLIIPVPDIQTADIISNDYLTFNNNSLIYNTTSFVETYFRSILMTIDGDYFSGSFQDAKKKIFKLTNLKTDSDYWNALTILFNVRNGVHNNGIYITNIQKYKSLRVSYRNRIYRFEQGFPFTGIDFNTLANIIEDILNLALELSDCDQIKSIPLIQDIGTIKYK
jgi:hypothetical protein